MLIIGCDYHPAFQQIAFVDTETGECGERRLTQREEAEQFYQDLKQAKCVATGSNSLTGYCVGPRGGICREAYDPTNCPPQTSVTNPQVDQCAQSSFTVDPTRSCTP
jgi:hypothetical protein